MRALRKLRTFHREQSLFEVVMEADDELRTIRLVHRSLMSLRPEARRRVVRYMVERHVSATEPTSQAFAIEPDGPLSEAESVAEAKRLMEQRA